MIAENLMIITNITCGAHTNQHILLFFLQKYLIIEVHNIKDISLTCLF